MRCEDCRFCKSLEDMHAHRPEGKGLCFLEPPKGFVLNGEVRWLRPVVKLDHPACEGFQERDVAA